MIPNAACSAVVTIPAAATVSMPISPMSPTLPMSPIHAASAAPPKPTMMLRPTRPPIRQSVRRVLGRVPKTMPRNVAPR